MTPRPLPALVVVLLLWAGPPAVADPALLAYGARFHQPLTLPEAPLAAPWRSQPGPGARRGSSPSSEPPEPVAGDRSLGAFRLDDEGRVCIEPNRAARGRCALFLQEDGIGYMLGETRGRMPFRVQMTLKP